MALGCTISWGSSPTTYALNVEEFTVNIRRSPLHAAMPGSDPLQIDMGYYDPSVSIRGILPTVPDTSVSPNVCDKNQLEDVVTDEFANSITLSIPAGAGDTSATNYVGQIGSFTCALRATKDSIYWTYNLTLLALSRT